MPQLNPSPWFPIFLLSWMILTTIIVLKTMKSIGMSCSKIHH